MDKMTKITYIPPGTGLININLIKSGSSTEGEQIAWAFSEVEGEPGAALTIVNGVPTWVKQVKPKEDLFDSLYKRMMK